MTMLLSWDDVAKDDVLMRRARVRFSSDLPPRVRMLGSVILAYYPVAPDQFIAPWFFRDWVRGTPLRLSPFGLKCRRHDRIPSDVRKRVIAAAPFCLICCAVSKLSIDHVVPVVFGGSDHPSNLRVLCGACNTAEFRLDFMRVLRSARIVNLSRDCCQ